MMKKVWVALLLIVFAGALSGCGAIRDLRFIGSLVDIEDINIDDYYAVLPITTTWDSFDYKSGGYVAFIKEDGSYVLTKLGYVEAVELSWDNNGLFFADREKEYWLQSNNHNIVRDVHKDAISYDAVIFPDKDHYMAFYNWGFEDDGHGYTYEMTIGDSEKVNKYVLHFALASTPVFCDNKVLVMTDERGMDDVRSGEPLDSNQIREIHRDGTSDIVASSDMPEVYGEKTFIVGMPTADRYVCVNDTMLVGIISAENAAEVDGPSYYILDFWDLTTGERKAVPLINENNEEEKQQALESDLSEDFSRWYQDGEKRFMTYYGEMILIEGWYVDGEYFYATVDEHGLLIRVNLDSGVVEFLNEPFEPHQGVENGEKYTYFYYTSTTYSNGTIYQFVYDPDQKEEPFIRELDAHSGKELKRIEVKGLNSVVIGSLLPEHRLAVNPHL